MGGFGSGGHNRCRPYCEEHRGLDIRWLKQTGRLAAEDQILKYGLNWSRGDEVSGTASVQAHPDRLEITHRWRDYWDDDWSEASNTIRISSTACNYGGTRKWLICPRCFNRRAVLYIAKANYVCRGCTNLVYASQGESTYDRLCRKKHKMEALLDSDRGQRMRDKTRHRLIGELCEVESRLDYALMMRFPEWALEFDGTG